ncbi:MAG: efflux RND transporter periplasmic adaptor subunit [Desulfohalobiaceae bacterium]|nr:efflux RND transporter periplasmic adaptor subunit [Desulfohalobiaceae bacterium]
MRRFVRLGLPMLALVALIIGAFLLVQNKRQELANAPKYGGDPRPVTVTEAEKGDLRLTRDYLAVVEPDKEADVAPRVQAEVEEVCVDEGDAVSQGDVLLRLDSAETRHRLQEVKARISEARAELSGNRATIRALEESWRFWQAERERARSLADKGSLSPSEAENTAQKAAEVRGNLESAREKSKAIQSRIRSLEQQKEAVESQLGYYTLKSPFSGVVAERRVDPGDMASPSRTLVRVQTTDRLKLAFDVPQKDLSRVSQGQNATFSVDGHKRSAPISLMHPSLNKARMMRAEVRLRNGAGQGLEPGAYVPLSVVLDTLRDATLVPRSSLIPSPEGQKHVFAVEQGRLEPRAVEVLGSNGDRAAVSGIDPGVSVVENTFLGWARLSSGEKVEAVR